jgi:hypothetical protein
MVMISFLRIWNESVVANSGELPHNSSADNEEKKLKSGQRDTATLTGSGRTNGLVDYCKTLWESTQNDVEL